MTDDDEDTTATMAALVAHHVGYPQGDPQPVSVTLTDEEWNAVAAALNVVVVVNGAEKAAILPPWMHNQIIDALIGIGKDVTEALRPLADNEVIREMERSLLREKRKNDEEAV